MNTIKITAQQFVKSLKDYTKSSADNNDSFIIDDKVERISAKEVMLYNQLIGYSKKELEDVSLSFVSRNNIMSAAIASKSELLVKGVLEKGACLDKLTEDSQWIVRNASFINLNVSKTVYWIEEHKKLNNRGGLNESEEERKNRDNLLYFLFSYVENPNYDLTDKYFKEFGKIKEKQKTLINYVKNIAITNPTFAEYITCKLKEIGVDINEYGTLNTLLPTYIPGTDPLNEKSYMFNAAKQTLWIGASDRSMIFNMIQLGFRFNEEVFNYQGDNLFFSIVKTEDRDLIKMIIPTLNNINPIDGDWAKQESYIDRIQNEDIKKIISSCYNKLKLDYELDTSNTVSNVKKVKI